MILDNYQNPERILSYTEALIITKKEYQILKSLAKYEKKRIELEICMSEKESLMNNLIIENNIKMSSYDDLSPLKKEVMLANAILPDDHKVIDTLTEKGFTLEHIKTIMKFRGILKNILLNESIIQDDLKVNIEIYKRVTSILIKAFKEKLNVNNSSIILNRICELLVTNPELFETLNDKKKIRK